MTPAPVPVPAPAPAPVLSLPTSAQLEPDLISELRVTLASHPDFLARLKRDNPTRWVYLYLLGGDQPIYLYHLTTESSVTDALTRHTHGDAVFEQDGQYRVGAARYRAVLGMPDVPGSRRPGADGLAAF